MKMENILIWGGIGLVAYMMLMPKGNSGPKPDSPVRDPNAPKLPPIDNKGPALIDQIVRRPPPIGGGGSTQPPTPMPTPAPPAQSNVSKLATAAGTGGPLTADEWNYYWKMVTGQEQPAPEDFLPPDVARDAAFSASTYIQYRGLGSIRVARRTFGGGDGF